VIDPRILNAKLVEKANQYEAANAISKVEYARMAAINQNAANALAAILGLKDYFVTQAQLQLSVTQMLDTSSAILDQFLKPKTAAK